MAGAAGLAQGRDRRRKIFRYVRSYMKKNGYAPSIAEIAEGVGLSSKTAVRHHVDKLVEDGHLTVARGRYRSLQVVEDGRRIA